MNQSQYADHAGVNRSTVTRWIKNGRISLEADGSIDPERADRQRHATESPMPHHQARKAQIDAHKAAQAAEDATAAQPATASEPLPAIEKIGAALKLETYKLQKAKAETANMELDKLAGALVERVEVDYVLADFGNTLRGLMEGLPDRLSGALAACRGDANAIHKELDDAARQLLAEIANHMARRAEERL